MSESRRIEPGHGGAAGFSMVELIVVVGLIAAMVGVAVPSMIAFIRSYAISGAAKDIASEMNTARYRAIMKNVNTGVLFVVVNRTTYMWAIEDDQNPQVAPDTETLGLDALLAEPSQIGVAKTLPTGVEFDDNVPTTDPAWRYDRFGSWCNPEFGVLECPDIVGFTGSNFVFNDAAGGAIRIRQPSTGLSRTLRIGTGGRVVIENF